MMMETKQTVQVRFDSQMQFEIGRTLDTGEPFCLNVESIVTGRTFLASITRWGKSWTDRKIIENCFGHAGIIIVDPEGEYSSLREKFAFLIIGKDIPLQLETAEFLAEEILKAKASVIIDLSMVEDDEYGKEYVNTFLRRFFFLETSLRQPYLVVVEEAEDFCGERGIGTDTCLHTLINIVKKGGKRGIGAIFIAHRPAWVSKGILSQCSNKAVGKVESTDFKALENYARIPSDVIAKLPDLGPGEFCFTGDWVKGRTFVKVGQVETTHLGYTPKVIPPSPQELRGVIATLQKALPQIIEKVKPTVVPIEQIRAELETKYRARLEAVQRTADEKAERKFKVEMDNLKSHNDKLSRSQALQPTAPITDVLEHPIVRTRMTELNDKARDLLTKVEREQGLTRQQLAAFLTTSTDSVANLIVGINKLFRAEVIVGDGKPIRYRSVLKRLFLTDVAKREIEELQRLQNLKEDLSRKLAEANGTIEQLRIKYAEAQGKTTETESLRVSLAKANQKLSELNAEIQRLLEEKKQLMIVGKAGESLATVINMIVDRRLSGFTPNNSPASLDVQKIQDLINVRLKEEIQKIPQAPLRNATDGPEIAVGLERTVTIVDVASVEKLVTINTESMRGKVLAVAKKGKLDTWRRLDDIVKAVEEEHWSATPQEVNNALNDLEKQNLIAKKHTDRNYYCLGQGVKFKEGES
jgi:hypothetical protein